MKLKCKTGDLAVLIRTDHPANLGKLVRVCEFIGALPAGLTSIRRGWAAMDRPEINVWVCEPLGPTMLGAKYGWGIAPDSWLEPLPEIKEEMYDETAVDAPVTV